jgi:hypothetical protein
LPSIETAIAPLPPSLASDRTAASAVCGRRTVRDPTIGSYCSNTKRFEAIEGALSSASSVSSALASGASRAGGAG